jgi:hypothetical protein
MTDLKKLHETAREAAAAAAKVQDAKLGAEGARGFDCGFAWVIAPKAKLSTKEGKALAELGFKKSWGKGLCLWYSAFSPSMTQSVSVHYAAARAYAETMKAGGLECYADQRLD